MSSSLATVRHFARLVALLLDGASRVDDQKAQLRAIMAVSRDLPVALSAVGETLLLDGGPLPEAIAGAEDLASRLAAHGLLQVALDPDATAADVLGLARALAADPAPEAPGRALADRLAGQGARTVSVVVAGGAAAPASAPPAHPPLAGAGDEGDDPMWRAFAARRVPAGTAGDVVSRLDAARSLGATLRALDDLVTLAEDAQQRDDRAAVGEVFHAIVARERSLTDAEARRAYEMAIRRLSRPTALRAVVRLLVERRDRLEEHMAVLARAGEEGTDAVIEALTASEDMKERRAFFDSLTRLNAAVPTLVHMLGDQRWYVARNAADLLGELRAAAGEAPLVELVKHEDDRVRRAAVVALAALGTPRAMQTVHAALADASPQVRMGAAVGLASRRGQASVVTLVRALDEETDAEVQQTILTTLGRLGTPEAIAKLVKVAEPEGWLFNRKPTPMRVQAVRALAEAKASPQAVSALRSLKDDRAREVRDAALRALGGRAS